MKTPPAFVQLIFAQGFFHCLCYFIFWGVVVMTNLLSSPFFFFFFLDVSCVSYSMIFTSSSNLQFHFPHHNSFCCHWHLAAVISMDYFVSGRVWMASQSSECNTSKRCNRTFEIQVLLGHVPTPLQRSPSFYALFLFRMALSSG